MVARKRKADITIEWAQQSRQMSFLRACGLSHPWDGGGPTEPRAEVILYGGAAGGGKSDALLMAGIVAGLTYPGISIGYFRREFPMLEGPGGAIMRSHELMSGWARWHGGQRRWTFPTGSVLQFCHCKAEEDVYNYQSQQFDLILIDEATQFLRSQYRYLRTRNRATRDSVIPFMALASNPGNVGHLWAQAEFIDPGPPEQVHEVEVEPGVFEKHLFIPAFLSDNIILEQRDPGYRARLEAQPEIVRRQLLEGDWSVFAGQYFKEWRPAIHVVQPFEIPHYWRRFRSLDYGLDCTACYWWAVSQDGRCYVYRELYQPDLILSEAAERIRELTPANERIDYTVASPDLWNRRQDTGVAGYELLIKGGLTGIIRADDRRVPGWRLMREYLKPYRDEQGQEVARLAVFDTCHNLIRTLPALIHDTHNPEDVSDGCEDHGPECLVAGTRVITSTGERLIEDIEPGELVLTRKGFKQVVKSGVTGLNVPVCTVVFSNGTQVTGTANHPVWVNGKGFVPIECMQYGDLVETASIRKGVALRWLTSLNSAVSSIGGIKRRTTGAIGCITDLVDSISGKDMDIYTERFGHRFTAKFQKATTSTTKMGTRLTTTLKTLSAYLKENTCRIIPSHTMQRTKTRLESIWRGLGHLRLNGIIAKKPGRLGEGSGSKYGKLSRSKQRLVNNAALNLSIKALALQGSVAISASQGGEEITNSTTKSASVPSVENHIPPTDISRPTHVPENAVRVVGFYRAGIATVYNLQVEEAPEFYANGVLVHNSIRYGIMSRPPLTVEEEERDRRRKWKKARTKPVISEITGY